MEQKVLEKKSFGKENKLHSSVDNFKKVLMPFVDLNTKKPDTYSPPGKDIIIVGAGTAGILLAVSLVLKGKSVMIIESGNFCESEEKQKLNSVQQSAKIVKNAVWGRKRVIGGTTIAWGGQSLPFTPIDFEKREWVENSGWPISFQELASYYKAADLFMDIDILNYDSDIFPKIKLKDPGIDKEVFDLHVAKWTNNKNFYKQFREILEDKVLVIYNAQVTGINKCYQNKVSGIEVSNFSNRSFIFPVKTLIIAAGTIETVRLLLNNDLVNNSGLLGKYFMEHPCIEVGTIATDKFYQLQKNFNTHICNGRKYSIRLSLCKSYQEKNQLLNCSASIMFRIPKDSLDIYAELKSFKIDFKFHHLIKISRSFKSLLKCAGAYAINRFYYKPDSVAKLSLMIEQEPSEDSYVGLSENKDQFGIPEPLIHWTITAKTWETVIATSGALKKQIEDLDFGEVQLYKFIDADTADWQDYLSDVCHNMGGCRMSDLPNEGVVNKNLQVWGVPNLFICSQAVFPTASHSNPVLTMLALGLRLVDHLTIVKENKVLKEDMFLSGMI